MFRAMWEEMAGEQRALRGTARQVLLSAGEIFAVNVEVDEVRAAILDRYRRLDGPVTAVMSTSMAGRDEEGPAPWLNRNWRAGGEPLARECPQVAVSWIDGDHGLVFTHAREVAGIVRAASGAG